MKRKNVGSMPSSVSKNGFTLADEHSLLLNSGSCKSAFTLAEMLITLSVIGIVAALTIPGVVKKHNEKAWSTAQNVFQKKLEVALKSMNVQGKLSGYTTTEDFVNELKKNIKITKICTDDVTKCFTKTVTWKEGEEPVEVSNDAVTYKEGEGYDWAETVGLQFNNGVTALLAYNKNCYADAYDNQAAVGDKCVGYIIDVTANGKPNSKGKDILSNANVEELAGATGCEYTLADGSACFSKILAPGTGFSPFPMEINGETVTCSKAIEKGLITSDYTTCTYGEGGSTAPDYWAGAQYACGGKDKMPDQTILYKLAQELYTGTGTITKAGYSGTISLDTTKAAPFLAQSPDPSYFGVWARSERSTSAAHGRDFDSSSSNYNTNDIRHYPYTIAVCLGDSK